MNLKRNTLGGLVCVLLALSPACKGDDGETTMDASTGGPTTMTDPGSTSENVPTSGFPTEGTEGSATVASATDTGDEETGGTTGSPSDPEILMVCNDVFNGGDKLLQVQCECLVASGIFADVAECLMLIGEEDPVDDACRCEVYSHFPGVKEGLDCIKGPQATAVECTNGVMCMDSPEPLEACLGPYYDAIEACPTPPKEAQAQVAIQCQMIPPFNCGSGEVIPETWKCNFDLDCMDKSDEMGCPGSFMCADGTDYVPEGYKCDGYPDCMDMSDEAGCPQFMCANGMMILEQWKCNGVPDCEDMSDEGSMAGCPVFMCMNGMEIPEEYKCDGYPDCEDESDEGTMAMCPVFMCMNGTEIPEAFKCNGFPDCEDMSDEVDCPTFMCMSGESIPLDWKCDMEPDCEDASDEADCP